MKFSQNGLYIERYIKCANCGRLVYTDDEREMAAAVQQDKDIYCSRWCVEWAADRADRLKTAS